MSDLIAWLDARGIGQAAARLIEQDIDLATLGQLGENDLKELGFTLGLRRRLLHAIEEGLRRPVEGLAPANDHAWARRPKAAAERRHLTILFSDLAGSTELTAQLDPEEVSVVLRAYQNCCTAAIEGYGGRVSRFVGDGIRAYFGYPQAHEDDTELAVHAALAIVRNVSRLRPLRDIAPTVRVAIATGLVVIGEIIGTGESRQVDVIGETPNLAARLQVEASPNGIIISANTHRLTQGLFNCTRVGPLHLKGFPAPVVAWKVEGESVVESRFNALHGHIVTPMVGRDRELGLLLRCWDRAVAGEAQAVLVSGEAGIGKSRLLHELRSVTGPHGAQTIALYCSAHHQASALYPVINFYERGAGLRPDDTPTERLTKLEALLLSNGAELERTVPIVATLLSIPLGNGYAPLKLTPEELKEQALQLLIRRVRELSLRSPVLCIVEDAHWIDPTSGELLSRMIAALGSSCVLVVVTTRTTQEGLSQAPVVQLPLSRLEPHHAVELLKGVSTRAMPEHVNAEIIARADGVPLFIEELSKAVMESETGSRRTDGAHSRDVVVPATLQDSLMARLDRMSYAKPVAQLAAVLGRVFTLQLLSAVAPGSWQPIDAAIEALIAAEIILPMRGAYATFQFKHALLQDVAYQSLLKATRRDYHGQIARVIVEQFPDTVETQPEIVAHHFTEAGIAEEATDYWLKAGQRATRLSSNLDSISHFERGLSLLDSIDDPTQRARIEYRFCLALLTPLIAAKGYTAPELEKVFERALHLSEEIGYIEEIFPALYSRQVFELTRGQFDRAAQHAREALQIAARNPSSDSAPFAGRLFATLRLFRGEAEIACEQLRHMLAQYDPARHHDSAHKFGQDHLVACASYLALGSWHLGYLDQARKYSTHAIERARSLEHAHTLQFALAYGGAYFAAHCRDTAYLVATTSELVELGKAHSSRSWSAALTGLLGMLQIERGQTAAGITKLRTSLQALSEFNSMLWQPALYSWLAGAYATCGEVSQGLAAIAMGRQVAEGGEHWMDAELHRVEGELWEIEGPPNYSRAEVCIRQALAVAQLQSSRILELRAVTSLARLWQRQGRRRDEALAILEPAVAWFTEGNDNADLRRSVELMKALQTGVPV